VLLTQALFSNPDILLLDEPTNNLDINTIRWLENVLNESNATIIVISHDRHFLNQVCTHMADLDFAHQVYPGNYDDYMLASTQAKERQASANAKAKDKVAELQEFGAPLLGQQVEGAPGHQPHEDDRQDQDRGLQAQLAAEPLHPLRAEKRCTARARGREPQVRLRRHPLFTNLGFSLEAGENGRHRGKASANPR